MRCKLLAIACPDHLQQATLKWSTGECEALVWGKAPESPKSYASQLVNLVTEAFDLPFVRSSGVPAWPALAMYSTIIYSISDTLPMCVCMCVCGGFAVDARISSHFP